VQYGVSSLNFREDFWEARERDTHTHTYGQRGLNHALTFIFLFLVPESESFFLLGSAFIFCKGKAVKRDLDMEMQFKGSIEQNCRELNEMIERRA
jgi:hypothetical protein